MVTDHCFVWGRVSRHDHHRQHYCHNSKDCPLPGWFVASTYPWPNALIITILKRRLKLRGLMLWWATSSTDVGIGLLLVLAKDHLFKKNHPLLEHIVLCLKLSIQKQKLAIAMFQVVNFTLKFFGLSLFLSSHLCGTYPVLDLPVLKLFVLSCLAILSWVILEANDTIPIANWVITLSNKLRCWWKLAVLVGLRVRFGNIAGLDVIRFYPCGVISRRGVVPRRLLLREAKLLEVHY